MFSTFISIPKINYTVAYYLDFTNVIIASLLHSYYIIYNVYLYLVYFTYIIHRFILLLLHLMFSVFIAIPRTDYTIVYYLDFTAVIIASLFHSYYIEYTVLSNILNHLFPFHIQDFFQLCLKLDRSVCIYCNILSLFRPY